MARADWFPLHALEAVAQQLGRFVASSPALSAEGGPLEVLPPIRVWSLDLDLFFAFGSLAAAAKNVGRWHHQIRNSGRAVAYARSTLDPERLGAVEVREVCESELAERVDRAFAKLRLDLTDEPTLRILSLPAFGMSSLWVHREDDARSSVLMLTVPDPGPFVIMQSYAVPELREHLYRYTRRSAGHVLPPARNLDEIGWGENDVLRDHARPHRVGRTDEDVLSGGIERPRSEEAVAA